MRVLQIGKYYPPAKGGMENHLLLLTNELKKYGIDLKILVANSGSTGILGTVNGLKVRRVPKFFEISSAPVCPSLPYWIRKANADIFHVHLPNPFAVVSYLLARPKGKLVVTYHSDIVGRGKFFDLYRPLQERFLGKASKIIVTSENYLNSSPILPRFRNKVAIIPLGIDISEFQYTERVRETGSQIRDKFGERIILFVGRLSYYKGVECLLHAMKAIDANLLIIGSGPLMQDLKELAFRQLKLESAFFLGEAPRGDLIAHCHACDVFCLPSIARSEAFGIVQLEAMACGKPVVSTSLDTGVPFVNQHEKTGLIVPPKDSEALAGAINMLLDDKELREEYGENGRQRVERYFTKERMAEQTLEVYKEVLG